MRKREIEKRIAIFLVSLFISFFRSFVRFHIFSVDWIGMFVCLLSQLKSHKTSCRFANEQPFPSSSSQSHNCTHYTHVRERARAKPSYTHLLCLFSLRLTPFELKWEWWLWCQCVCARVSACASYTRRIDHTHISGLVKWFKQLYSEYVRFQTKRNWLTYLFKAVNSPADGCVEKWIFTANITVLRLLLNSLSGNVLHVQCLCCFNTFILI